MKKWFSEFTSRWLLWKLKFDQRPKRYESAPFHTSENCSKSVPQRQQGKAKRLREAVERKKRQEVHLDASLKDFETTEKEELSAWAHSLCLIREALSKHRTTLYEGGKADYNSLFA